MARVEIKQDEKSLTHVLVDGNELKRIIEYSLRQSFDTVPVLTVTTDGLGREVDLQNARVDIDVINQTLEDAVKIVRFELLKHGDFYNGFVASVSSALGDLPDETDLYEVAQKILNRIIGEEEQ